MKYVERKENKDFQNCGHKSNQNHVDPRFHIFQSMVRIELEARFL